MFTPIYIQHNQCPCRCLLRETNSDVVTKVPCLSLSLGPNQVNLMYSDQQQDDFNLVKHILMSTIAYTKKKYAHLVGAHTRHAHLPILLSHSCKVDLLCCLPREKGEKVAASGRKKKIPGTPLAAVYMSHAPLPKVLNSYVHTLVPPPMICGLG